jgi:cytochrome bd-type quinol oxidase subunit 2
MTVGGRERLEGVAVLGVAMVSVLAGTVAYIASRAPYLHTWRFVGDVDAGVGLLVIGGLIFPLATVLACRVERLRAPRRSDHFRQCSLLYAAFVLGGLALAADRDGSGSLGFAISAVAVAAGLVGVIANALTLAARASRARAT